ncbi:hypothetical protein PIB30_081069, partial [Stylosanthes scabra]|nr:hypothetical protein [Stylosanthes scabra]
MSGRTSPGWRGKNYAGVRMTWLRQRVQMIPVEMSGCLPLVLSWIYQRFPRFCPPGRSVMVFPLVSRLNGLALTTRDTQSRRQLEFRNELDRVGVDDVRIPELVDDFLRVDPVHGTSMARHRVRLGKRGGRDPDCNDPTY